MMHSSYTPVDSSDKAKADNTCVPATAFAHDSSVASIAMHFVPLRTVAHVPSSQNTPNLVVKNFYPVTTRDPRAVDGLPSMRKQYL